MVIFGRFARSLRRHVRRVSWLALFMAYVAHMLTTWSMLALAGESKLVALDAFPYYYMTTATTIGYGDLSPSSTAGRYIVAFLLMPGAVALFAAILTKTSAALVIYWKRHLMGKKSYHDMQGHTVLVGWCGTESGRLVNLLLSDTATDDEGIVLVAEGLNENPLPEQIRFVSVESYADSNSYARAALGQAGRVIVNTPNDDLTLAAVLAIKACKPNCHVVAHFNGAAGANLVRAHHPDVECTRPIAAEIIARAAQDPGSSQVTYDLLSAADTGAAQFSIQVPDGEGRFIGDMAKRFRESGAILLGFRATDESVPRLNPPPTTVVHPGSTLYYIRDTRLRSDEIIWDRAGQAVPA